MKKTTSLMLLAFAVCACDMMSGRQQDSAGQWEIPQERGLETMYVLVTDVPGKPVAYKLVGDERDEFSCESEKMTYLSKSVGITEQYVEPQRCTPEYRMTEEFKTKIMQAYIKYSDADFDPAGLGNRCDYAAGGPRGGNVLEIHCWPSPQLNRSAIIVTRFTVGKNSECFIESKMLYAAGEGRKERFDRSCPMAAEMIRKENQKTRIFDSVMEVWDYMRMGFRLDNLDGVIKNKQ
ncbi:MAG: hypothetical protein FWF97_04335 [Alphaproteobacteria bacterium]|nr:hypothetical protein [Alphaproteobacteria bacterium]